MLFQRQVHASRPLRSIILTIDTFSGHTTFARHFVNRVVRGNTLKRTKPIRSNTFFLPILPNLIREQQKDIPVPSAKGGYNPKPGVRCIAGALRNVLQRFPTQQYVSKKRIAALRGIPWSCLSESAFLQRTVA